MYGTHASAIAARMTKAAKPPCVLDALGHRLDIVGAGKAESIVTTDFTSSFFPTGSMSDLPNSGVG
jgi:hypothetical protein